jgi:quercetin dioxygenase-like cupin family protein
VHHDVQPADVAVTFEEADGSAVRRGGDISKREGKTMRRVLRTGCLGLVVTAIALGVSPGLAQNGEEVKVVFEHVIPNIEGKSMVAVVVTYPPGGKSPAHHHARSAFIYAHVLSGAIRSQVDDEPAKVYQVGEGFYEMPGSHHRISDNASASNPASLLAVFVVDSNDKPLTIPDQKSGSR